jgi:hypothetical protein
VPAGGCRGKKKKTFRQGHPRPDVFRTVLTAPVCQRLDQKERSGATYHGHSRTRKINNLREHSESYHRAYPATKQSWRG